ncbi:PLC-like phosphodiesterase [Aulographum hederae CBS 113979]|uniref:Phosphoinositide phospholipase C n=1 Tax=Aulographum hederae CBS 113979 TaxID=1176131 RepID=A0A6G1GT65_9PEZI|nr:PLC-like phosphodiesterase [Aulographum hederae CBS 113979]
MQKAKSYPTTLPPQELFARPTLPKQLITTIPFTVTPATAAPNSSRTSPTSLASALETNISQQSVQSTPDFSKSPGCSQSSLPLSIGVPDAALDAQSPPLHTGSSTSEAVSTVRSPGIMRRLSRGAHNKLSRARRTSTSRADRDQSAGPVFMRRRSDSNRGMQEGNDVSDFELEPYGEEALDDQGETFVPGSFENALGITTGRSSISSGMEGTVAPTRCMMLQQGTPLEKYTKKKKRTFIFRLDFDSAKICWDTSKPAKKLYIDDIRSITTRADARHYREDCQAPPHLESRWFTLVYTEADSSRTKQMHLVAPDDYTFRLWTTVLEETSQSRIRRAKELAGGAEKGVKYVWHREMSKKFSNGEHAEADEKLSFEEIRQICRSNHINCTEATLKYQFDRADSEKNGFLRYPQFQNLIKQLKERQDIKKIYLTSKPDAEAEIDMEHFFKFLVSTQGVDVEKDRAHWTKVFEKNAKTFKTRTGASPAASDNDAPPTLSLAGFQNFLSSPQNPALVPSSANPSLDRPLNEYFISCSHNTYLEGRQVADKSSTEAYITALQKGCRCIEIDCWDGSDGRPVVKHGRALTTAVLFADCISVIARYAFLASEYPLIISLEVHCNAEQQATMVDIMLKGFGEQLLQIPLSDDNYILPSPEQLKRKILIKVKAPEDAEESASFSELPSARRPRGLSSPFTRPITIDNAGIPPVPLSSPPSISPPDRQGSFWTTPKTTATASPNTSADDSDSAAPSVEKKKKKTNKITKVLGDLGVYTRGIKYSDFKSPEAKTYNHIYSFGERTFHNTCTRDHTAKALLEEHNKRYLMRVYPHGGRIMSDNFDPLIFWRRGVQMAALNWQKNDVAMQINHAMFAAGTDKTGYVLKPVEMRPAHHLADIPLEQPSKVCKKLVKFSVEIVSAQQLPRPRSLNSDVKFNPYVVIEMYSAEDKGLGVATAQGGMDASGRADRRGMSGIGMPVKKYTRAIEGNGYDPTWDQPITLTLTTKYPSLVFVRWCVYHSPNPNRIYEGDQAPLATYTAKLSSLQQGYRHLPLYDQHGDQYLFSNLFCKIAKEDHVDLAETSHATSVACSTDGTASPNSPPIDGRSGKRDFFKRAFSRTPSERKRKDTKESTTSGESGFFSRTTSVEK